MSQISCSIFSPALARPCLFLSPQARLWMVLGEFGVRCVPNAHIVHTEQRGGVVHTAVVQARRSGRPICTFVEYIIELSSSIFSTHTYSSRVCSFEYHFYNSKYCLNFLCCHYMYSSYHLLTRPFVQFGPQISSDHASAAHPSHQKPQHHQRGDVPSPHTIDPQVRDAGWF
jgi:hypothetical protein